MKKIGIVAILLIAGMLLLSGCVSDKNPTAPNPGGLNPGGNGNVAPGVTETPRKNVLVTTTPATSKTLKLAKEYGPYDFPSEGQSSHVDIEVGKIKAVVSTGSDRIVIISLKNFQELSTAKEPLVIAIQHLKSDETNLKCNTDKEINICYSKKLYFLNNGALYNDEAKLTLEELKKATKWKVLVYSS